jgi:hypothetical protein
VIHKVIHKVIHCKTKNDEICSNLKEIKIKEHTIIHKHFAFNLNALIFATLFTKQQKKSRNSSPQGV